MRSVNTVVIPELSEELIIQSIKTAHEETLQKETAERKTAMDFYYHHDVDKHIDKWFSKSTLEQIPSFPQRIVPRFARARMMLYKNAPVRMINGEINDDYKKMAHRLDNKTREFAELTWLTGEMGLRTKWNEKNEQLEYDLIPLYRKYFVEGESEPFAVSYEIGRDRNNNRIFVFFSEPRDGIPGKHFKFTQGGKIIQVNEENVNPYECIPISFSEYNSNAYDVIRAAVHLGIAYTEIALATRFAFGQPVISGIDEGSQIKLGIDKVMILGEGADFNFKGTPGNLMQMIEAAKAIANQTAINHHLRIKWDDSGNPASGEALRLMEIENLEARISDIPLWRDWEHQRYNIDREVIRAHTGKDFSENYSVDFAEVEFPLSPQEERSDLAWKLDKGLINREDLVRHFNPDITDEDLNELLGRVDESKRLETEATQPTQPTFEGLRKLGTVGA